MLVNNIHSTWALTPGGALVTDEQYSISLVVVSPQLGTSTPLSFPITFITAGM